MSTRAKLLVAASGLLSAFTLALYAWGSGEPTHNDPIAVRVSANGAAIDVAVDPCLLFRTRQVTLSAIPVTNDLVDLNRETVVTAMQVAEPQQHIFRFSPDGSTGNTPFLRLGTLPKDRLFAVHLLYDQASAPRGFTDRRTLSKTFRLHQSTQEVATYDRLSSRTCKG